MTRATPHQPTAEPSSASEQEAVAGELETLAAELERRHLRGAVKASDDFADRLVAGLQRARAALQATKP